MIQGHPLLVPITQGTEMFTNVLTASSVASLLVAVALGVAGMFL